VQIQDRHVIRAEDEFELKRVGNFFAMKRNDFRQALVLWTVTQTFKKRSFDNSEVKDEPSEDDMFTLRYGKEWVEVPFIRDIRTNKLITNSAKDKFNPVPTRREAIRTYVLSRKERQNRLRLYDEYENVVNADEWHGMPAGTVLMESITPNWDGNIFSVEYSFKYNRRGWGEKYLDLGIRELRQERIDETDETNPKTIKKYYPILSEGSQTPVEEPAKLDGRGEVPVHRKNKVCPFLDDQGKPLLDDETGEVLWFEEGEKNEKDYPNFPGVDVPFDYPSEFNRDVLNSPNEQPTADQLADPRNYRPIPQERQKQFWKYYSLPFDVLKIPDPYRVDTYQPPNRDNESW
jgi:hypothetical protein